MVKNSQELFELPRAPIPPGDIKETFTADVVVVGAGTSGKAAALTAAQAGAGVIQIDKHTTFRWGGGHIAAIGSRLQKKLGIKVDKEDTIKELMRWGGNRPDQRFYRLWTEQSGAVMDWLIGMAEKAGVETVMYQWPLPEGFDAATEYYPEYPVCHWHSQDGSRILNHSLVLQCLQNEAVKLGVDIRYRTRGVQLVRPGKGRVAGIIARNEAGDFLRFDARNAVVLCTGDYGNNPQMMQKYAPLDADIARDNNIYMFHNDNLKAAREPLNVGDGHRMAMRIGAVMEAGPPASVAHATVGPVGNGAFLRVNINGLRYENEDVPGQSIANSLVRQPGKKVWQIFDAKWEEELPRMGVGLGKMYVVNDILRERLRDMAVKADTIEELAQKINVPVATLRATLDRYNELAGLGKDLDYGKRPDRLTSVARPPFYAALIQQEFLVVLGGLNANMRMQPLDAGGNVIKGLYLAGNTVGNRFAVDYPTMCPGLTHALAYLTGRIAGRNAAADSPKG
ncbi:MAG TPA: FAD-dependent oxidoreductase [Dehalococcoidales bacterium]|nr:FAD-dependent oxidoreductase [Dehalococcoidales bacterium]